ncbi:MAG: integral rane sensor signal transduction histidine kinase [Acidimicrobiales bacterium]|nr:integral rane sensor signal transduction histidine kinase [Acidimicrobiales bacterium]
MTTTDARRAFDAPVTAAGATTTAWWTLVGAAAIGLVGWASVIVERSKGGAGFGWVVAGVTVTAWAAAGLTMLRKACPLGRLALVGSVAAALAFVGEAGRVAHPNGGLAADLALALGAAALPALGLHLLLGLPDGDLLTPARRGFAVAGYGAATVAAVAWLLGPRAGWGWVIAVTGSLAAAAGLAPANQRYRAAVGVTRLRLQWIGCAVALAGEVALVVIALRLLTGWPHDPAVVVAVGALAVPIALMVSATHLVGRVDRLLVATVSTTGLTGVVVTVYVVVVLGLGHSPGQDRQLLVLSMAAAGIAALLYVPARERLTDQANRLVYGERYAPDETIRTFGSRLSRAVPMDELLLQLAESLRKTFSLLTAEVWTGGDGRYDLAVSVPEHPAGELRIGETALPIVARAGVSGTAWVEVWLPELLAGREGARVRTVPISHSGELLGLIVLVRAPEADAFSEDDDQALGELARQVALALHNVQLDSALQASLDEVRRYAGELQASRARIVASGDAERRKIERNLHDGAQQHLVALAVNLRLAKDLVLEDPDTAAEMLGLLADSVKETIQELRDLAHGIYPPLLMDSGLPEALRAAAARNPSPTEVDADVGRYPSEAEAAVYFCCLEAMQNASKHAPGATLRVRVWEDEGEGRLAFTVADDGPGFDVAAATAGHGYVNMSDRLGAIGGTVDWQSAPGEGATVTGSIPLR